jgi:hypothetical protein
MKLKCIEKHCFVGSEKINFTDGESQGPGKVTGGKYLIEFTMMGGGQNFEPGKEYEITIKEIAEGKFSSEK